MDKFAVTLHLENLKAKRDERNRAIREFDKGYDYVMRRLLFEAARNFMSVHDVAKAAGLTNSQVRVLMRKNGLNPQDGKTLLSKYAAEALASNAELLGIEPHEMDLMSPLAYLPVGEQMRREINEQGIAGVVESPEETTEFRSAVCGKDGCPLPVMHPEWGLPCLRDEDQ